MSDIEKSSLVQYAERELRILSPVPDEMQQAMNKHILEMVQLFSDQHHSGFSANYALSLLRSVLAFKPITPLTGEDDEWADIGGGLLQNKRCGQIFKEQDTGEVYDSCATIFSDNGGKTFYQCELSRKSITFPYSVPAEPVAVILTEERRL